MSDGYAYDPGELGAASGTLSGLAGSLEQQSGTITVSPDAGRSSQEVADAFTRLSGELRALSQAVTGLADDVEASLGTYQGTDGQVAASYDGMVPR